VVHGDALAVAGLQLERALDKDLAQSATMPVRQRAREPAHPHRAVPKGRARTIRGGVCVPSMNDS